MAKKKNIQFEVMKINIREFIKKDDDGNKYISPLTLNKEEKNKFRIKQNMTFVFYQLSKVREFKTTRVDEIIFLEAKHNKKQLELQEECFNNGIVVNGELYLRFGKSNSQAKDGITVFMREDFYDSMNEISNLDLDIEDKEIVISKYESYRNLIFSSCTIIDKKMPYIVVVDEFEKTIPKQLIRYVVREDTEFKNEDGTVKKYEKRKIEEGEKDLMISPFDGCGCHRKRVGEMVNEFLELSYRPVSLQVRLPMVKGVSVEVDFDTFYKEHNITEITDVFGKVHQIKDIDCIWNTSMWKGYKYFKSQYENNAWNMYLKTLEKYDYKFAVSKYSHHVNKLDKKRRFNFQYLQTLDLLNEKYVDKFKNRDNEYDILDSKNDGKMINLAKYSTEMFEKIVDGDKFYSMKFLGINDTSKSEPNTKYLEAVMINDSMLKDPMIKKLLRNTTKKFINDMKYGKIYVDGFYHTIVGDMKAYLEYCGGLKVEGCLDAWSVYSNTTDNTKATLFRSPCVCSSEVSNVKIDKDNEFALKYMSNLKGQDVIMFSAKDILMPQLGGADADGDITFVCTDDMIYNSKINKPIIIDIEDKATALPLEYNKANVTAYELNSRDSRIGEITNIATSILNNHTTDEKWKGINDKNISLLRIYQGKEIDFIKTGKRWVITKSLRRNLKKLPYFMLYNYPKRMEVYKKRIEANKKIESKEEKVAYNCFMSPSPMNELCDYIESWERKNVLWSKESLNTSYLLLDNSIDISDDKLFRKCREVINSFSKEWSKLVKIEDKDDRSNSIHELYIKYKKLIYSIETDKDIKTLANYFIKASTYRIQINKHLCWEIFGDYMLDNLRNNTPKKTTTIIEECEKDTIDNHEFLGKYYIMKEE